MTRIVAAPDGTVGVGPGPGRGAWCCSVDCFDRAVRRRALGRALRREIANDDLAAVRARLIDEVRPEIGRTGGR
jgi:predicted RNA-binding protein YlxR (DUF448 family)